MNYHFLQCDDRYFTPLSIMTFATLRPELRDQGTALYTLTRNLGGAIGIAVGVSILANSIDANIAEILAYFTPFADSPISSGQIPWPTDDSQGLFLLKADVIRRAILIAYKSTLLFIVFAIAAVIPVIFILKPAPQLAPP